MTDGDDRIASPRDPATVGVERTETDMTDVVSGDRRRSAELIASQKETPQTHSANSALSNEDSKADSDAPQVALEGATDVGDAGDASQQAAVKVTPVVDDNGGLPVNNMWLVMPACVPRPHRHVPRTDHTMQPRPRSLHLSTRPDHHRHRAAHHRRRARRHTVPVFVGGNSEYHPQSKS